MLGCNQHSNKLADRHSNVSLLDLSKDLTPPNDIVQTSVEMILTIERMLCQCITDRLADFPTDRAHRTPSDLRRVRMITKTLQSWVIVACQSSDKIDESGNDRFYLPTLLSL